MVYLLPALAAALLVGFIVLWAYSERVERKRDAAETAAFLAINQSEREVALAQAKRDRTSARLYFDQMHRLWRSYKWGYRRNPYMGDYLVARAQYARACRTVDKLEKIIAAGFVQD